MSEENAREKYSDENVRKALAAIAGGEWWDLLRYFFLRRYEVERANLRSAVECPGAMNRAVGAMAVIEDILADFGERPFGGLPVAAGIPAEDARFVAGFGLDGIEGGNPGSPGF